MSRRTEWKTCACGRGFRAYKFDTCDDCRRGHRPHQLRQRIALRDRKARNRAVKEATA